MASWLHTPSAKCTTVTHALRSSLSSSKGLSLTLSLLPLCPPQGCPLLIGKTAITGGGGTVQQLMFIFADLETVACSRCTVKKLKCKEKIIQVRDTPSIDVHQATWQPDWNLNFGVR